MATRKEREIEFKEKLIIDAAEKLFIEKDFENTKMEDIAREADYTKPTLYKYFSSKEEILLAVYMRGWITSYELIVRSIKKKESGFEKLLATAKAYNDYFSKNPIYFSLIKYVHTQGIRLYDANPKKKQEFEHKSKEKINFFTTIISDGIADGSIDKEIEPNIATKLFLNNLYIVMHTYYNEMGEEKSFLNKATKLMMKVFKSC